MTTSAFTISRSEYVFGRPRDGVAGSAGQGSRSTSLTSVTRTLGCRSILYLRDIHVGVQRYYGAGRAWSRRQRGCFFSAVRFLNHDHVSPSWLSLVLLVLPEQGFWPEITRQIANFRCRPGCNYQILLISCESRRDIPSQPLDALRSFPMHDLSDDLYAQLL